MLERPENLQALTPKSSSIRGGNGPATGRRSGHAAAIARLPGRDDNNTDAKQGGSGRGHSSSLRLGSRRVEDGWFRSRFRSSRIGGGAGWKSWPAVPDRRLEPPPMRLPMKSLADATVVATAAGIANDLGFSESLRSGPRKGFRRRPAPSCTIGPMSTPPPLIRTGLGYDSHRLGSGGPLRLGGVDVPGPFHAIGHSDADVLFHAITDGILGSVAAPDIGRLFPDTQEENRGRDSRDFLREATRRLGEAGYQISNLDAVVLLQKPKLADWIDPIRRSIADCLGCDVTAVGLKAKTGEGVDAVGRCEAIAARVVVLVVRSDLSEAG